MRRLVILGLTVAILAALWSGGWFALARWAEGQVGGALARIAARGVEVDCGSRRIVGFPFALKVACGETAVAARAAGADARLAGLTGGASVFAPRTASIALVAPVSVTSPLLAGPAEIRWSEADVDIAMSMAGPRGLSFSFDDLDAALPVGRLPDAHVSARSASGMLSPSGEGGTDAAFAFAGLTLAGAGAAFPPFDGTGSASLSPPPRALLSGRAGLQAPVWARDIDVSLRAGAARLHVGGAVAVDAEGLLDGEIAIRIAGADHLPAFIAALPPERQAIGNAVATGILAFGRPATLDGETASELVLRIERGRTRVGPVPVTLPRIPF